MERRKTRNRYLESARKKRRKRSLFFCVFLILCCMLSFCCGKTVGRAQKKAQAGFGRVEWERGTSGSNEKGVQTDGTAWSEDAMQESGGALILVIREHPLPEDYEADLVTFQNGVTKGAKEAYDPLCQMLRAGIKEGLTFKICSAYRSTERQKELFEEDVNALMAKGYSYEKACEEVARETMPPGCSEHATGLAFDIVACDHQLLDETQENTAENQWLREHCAEYGFILRYPKDKEEVTGIRYESWHFRYVGVEAAREITERGIALEEYLEGYGETL